MGIVEILSLISGIFKFLDQVKWLVQTLEGTPEEHRQKIIAAMRKEADAFAQTGRPPE